MEAKETISQMMSKVCITDQRMEGKVKYTLLPTIFAIIIAWCAGCNSCVMVESYWKYNRAKLKELIEGFPEADISHDTVNRIMRNIVFSEFHEFLTEFSRRLVENNPQMIDVRRVLSLDGQTPKAIEYDKREPALGKSPDDRRLYDRLYFVTLQDTTNGISMGLDPVQDKENENKACVRLLDLFDLSNATVTCDALNTQRSVAEKIIEKNGDYCMALKDNHKSLAKAVREGFGNPEYEEFKKEFKSEVEKGHGRIESRAVFALPATVIKNRILKDWAKDCNTLFMTVTESINVKYGNSRAPEVRFFLSSLCFDTPDIAEFGYRCVREHWKIENSLHYVLDMDFGQDHMQMKNRNLIKNIELLNRISLNILRLVQPMLKKGSSIRMTRYAINLDPSLALKGLAKYMLTEENA